MYLVIYILNSAKSSPDLILLPFLSYKFLFYFTIYNIPLRTEHLMTYVVIPNLWYPNPNLPTRIILTQYRESLPFCSRDIKATPHMLQLM